MNRQAYEIMTCAPPPWVRRLQLGIFIGGAVLALVAALLLFGIRAQRPEFLIVSAILFLLTLAYCVAARDEWRWGKNCTVSISAETLTVNNYASTRRIRLNEICEVSKCDSGVLIVTNNENERKLIIDRVYFTSEDEIAQFVDLLCLRRDQMD